MIPSPYVPYDHSSICPFRHMYPETYVPGHICKRSFTYYWYICVWEHMCVMPLATYDLQNICPPGHASPAVHMFATRYVPRLICPAAHMPRPTYKRSDLCSLRDMY